MDIIAQGRNFNAARFEITGDRYGYKSKILKQQI